MNELIFILSMLFFLGAVIVAYKFFGKTALFVFIVFATILANLEVTKSVNLFGFATTLGNTMYAIIFLCTDIISEKYGKKEAQKSVYLGLGVTFLWLIGTQVALLFEPNDQDFVQSSMEVIFGFMPRIAIASFAAYGVSQSVDVFLYHKIWDKTDKLWIRNNGSTFVSQLIDSIIFVSIAFIGTYEFNIVVSIFFTTYLFKVIVAFIDTPFMYLARKIKPIEEMNLNKEVQQEVNS